MSARIFITASLLPRRRCSSSAALQEPCAIDAAYKHPRVKSPRFGIDETRRPPVLCSGTPYPGSDRIPVSSLVKEMHMMEVRRLGSQIGAEVNGVDVKKLDDAGF